MGHTDLSKDLNNIPGFIPKWNYPNQAGAKIGAEWGAVNNIRVFLSSVGLVAPQASALGNAVYSVFVQGLEAVGACLLYTSPSPRDRG